MDTRASIASGAPQPAQVAKAALKRLVESKLEPTPENYARAYRAEGGHNGAPMHSERALHLLDRLSLAAGPNVPAADRRALAAAILDGRWELAERALDKLTVENDRGAALASLIGRIVRGVERGGRQWTSGRRKESLQRVLAGSHGDAGVLQARLAQLLGTWDKDCADEVVAAFDPAPGIEAAAQPAPVAAVTGPQELDGVDRAGAPARGADHAAWAASVAHLSASLHRALAATGADEQAAPLAALTQAIVERGATVQRAEALLAQCEAIDRVLQHRHHLVDQLGGLCRELTAGLTDLAEDDSWAKGQLDSMLQKLDDGINARGVKAATEVLRHTRERQRELRDERSRARDALKSLMSQMLQEMGELGSRTGRFHDNIGRYAQVINGAQSLEGLTGVVGEMLEETRSVQDVVGQTQQRLQAEHARAAQLTERVATLESELRRLSDEVTTDQLTRVANRRGLLQAFEVARARAERDGQPLSIGLLDVDNFKRLNDELGHGVGDVALRSLAEAVAKSLRPDDVVARYGGEEFVVLLPATDVDEGQQILTRLQRSLSGGLFMHERRQVLVTFSAGVTLHRAGDAIEPALERADQALYEAKRTGKNRTCVA
jgi:diguanylate cyclase